MLRRLWARFTALPDLTQALVMVLTPVSLALLICIPWAVFAGPSSPVQAPIRPAASMPFTPPATQSPFPDVPTAYPTTASPKPKPKPSPSRRPKPKPKPEPESVYYANCAAVRAAGAAPLHRGDPGYSGKLDRDGDGVACEG